MGWTTGFGVKMNGGICWPLGIAGLGGRAMYI